MLYACAGSSSAKNSPPRARCSLCMSTVARSRWRLHLRRLSISCPPWCSRWQRPVRCCQPLGRRNRSRPPCGGGVRRPGRQSTSRLRTSAACDPGIVLADIDRYDLMFHVAYLYLFAYDYSKSSSPDSYPAGRAVGARRTDALSDALDRQPCPYSGYTLAAAML